MFDNLTDRLSHSLRNVTGSGRLTEDNIKDTLREVRMALLEADVALPVVKDFIDRIREQALGQEVMQALSPGQAFVKIVHDELVRTMGDANESLNLATTPPAVILMAGLQGAGKTTTVGKLAKYLQEREKKKVLVVSADIYRPAAIRQLEMVAADVGAIFFPSTPDQHPNDIARGAIAEGKLKFADVVIIDTAGRLHIDEEMMGEIKSLHAAINPVETLFVVDAMTGQDAANTAKAFNDALPLTGVILTKTDGDARGGAALSVRMITGKPIKFLGMGEKSDALEPFHPDRVASRILGMGDVLSLVEEVERKLDKDKAEKLANKLKKGKGFDLQDLLEQFQQMRNLGGMGGLLDKLPGMNSAQVQQALAGGAPEKEMKRMEAIILSMTMAERHKPDLINGSRKRRIAAGSGTQIQDVNRVLKQHTQMEKMMKKMSSPSGMMKMMRGMKGMMGQGGGGMPPGMGGAGGMGGLPGTGGVGLPPGFKKK
ncbi:MAG: signal recognition particle protein [Moraxellaceae bacterium]|nr:signal recognition particle protein [Moraxellaceae bacterium]MBP7228922.1 signal recognition particle protein [Moraxellaceae bacterium]MBP8851533.1 signal recognition particle protein [Moraxellaceae bacterium]MBP9045091.1 signal recognition particle protein [Moraxellaceae bacterium]MBP9729919.1 signal recognition particle protein [Moraxellaceae bacterium]